MGVDLADLYNELSEVEGLYPLPLPVPDYIQDLFNRGVITAEQEKDFFMEYVSSTVS